MTSSSESPTLGELNRNVVSLRDELRETRSELATIHELRTRAALNTAKLADHETRLDELDDANRWVVRLVIGAVILALVGILLSHPEVIA